MAVVTPPMLNQSTALIKLESSFLDLNSFINGAKTCKTLLAANKDVLKAAKLLDLVLNLDDNKKQIEIENIIEKQPELILMKVMTGNVKHYSTQQKKIAIRKQFTDVTPLEAAALSGDFPLVNLFDACLTDELRPKAAAQLGAVLARPGLLDDFVILCNAYRKFIPRYNFNSYPDNDWTELMPYWEIIGDGQKALSNFGLRVFFDPSESGPNHTSAEYGNLNQGELYEPWKKVPLDLDYIGKGTKRILLRQRVTSGWDTDYRVRTHEGRKWACPGEVINDVKVFDNLLKLIPEELNKTKERFSRGDSSKKIERENKKIEQIKRWEELMGRGLSRVR